MKAVLRGKFIPLSAYIRKWKKSHTSDLTEHLKALEQRTNLPRSRQQEIIKLRAEISKIETNRIQRIYGAKSWLFEKKQERQTLMGTNQTTEKDYIN